MAGNIHLNFTANSNMASVQAQMEAMRKTMHRMNADVQKFNRTVATQGKVDFDGWNRLNSEITTSRNELNNLAQQSGAYTTATRTLTSATTQFNNALGRQSVRLRDVIGQGGKIRGAMREQMALNNMIARGFSMDATGRIQADLWVPKAGDIGRFESLNKQVGYYNHILRSVSQETVNWGKNTQWTGRQLTVGFSVPISIAMGLLGKFALQADTDLTRIVKVYGDTESAFENTTESIRAMATNTSLHIAQEFGKAAEETREVMAELAATGMAGPELQGMTYQVQRLSMLGEMDSSEALKLSRILKEVYGFSSAELEKQVNYFNAIENSTALTMQDITEGMPRIAGIMKSTGVSIQEQTELLVAFKSAGIDVAEGANALKSINFKAVAATPTAASHFFRITGVEMQDLIDETEGRFIPMMQAIADTMTHLDDQAKVDLVARVFGIHQGSRAITLLDQLSEGSAGMMRAIEVGQQSAGEHAVAARKEIEALQESASHRFKSLLQTIRVSMASIGESVLAVIIPVGEQIARFFKWIDGLDEATKKWVVSMAAVLAAVGPFIMLIGLFANLVGMAGRGVGAIVGLAFKFEILNAETKAGRLLQEAYNKTLNAGTLERDAHRKAMEGMTRAMNDYNVQLQREIDLKNRASATPAPRRLNEAERYWEHDSAFAQERDAPARREEQQTYWNKHSAIAQERDKRGNAVKQAMIRQRELEVQTEKTRLAIGKFSQGMGIASMAGLTLGSVLKNDTMVNISGVGLAISSVLPLLPMVSKGFLAFATNTSMLFGRMGNSIREGINNGIQYTADGLAKLKKIIIGPWGVAIGAAIALVAYKWNEHRKAIAETEKMYRNLADSAESLGKVYDFMPTTPLQRELEHDPAFDQDTQWGQRQRIQELKKDSEEYYDSLVEWSERARQTMEGEALQREAMNQAIAQGTVVLQNTGDPEKAKRAAWDVHRIITGEFTSFDEFKIKIGLDGQSVDDILSDIDSALQQAGERTGNRIRTGLLEARGNRWGDAEMVNAVRADIEGIFAAAAASSDIDAVGEALNQSLGDVATKLHESYHFALRAGLIDSEVTMKEFAERLPGIYSQAQSQGMMMTGLYGMDKAQVKLISDAAIEMERVENGILRIIQTDADFANVFSGRDVALRQIAGQEMAILEIKIEQLEAEGNIEAAQRARARLAQVRGRAEQIRLERIEAEKNENALNLMNAANEDAIGNLRNHINSVVELNNELDETEQKAYDAFRKSMEHYQNQQVDYYAKQFEAHQKAEQDALEAEGRRLIDNINARYEIRQEAMAAQHKAEQDAQSDRFEQQKEALALERERAQEEMRKAREQAQEAQTERQRLEQQAMRDQHEAQGKALEEAQERRRKQIEEVWDVQIERIQHQIDEEERLEQIRQRLFDNERQRISRLREMFSGNIDLNMAINSGDLDEAARISNEMSTKRSEWEIDDLSQIMADGSQTRKDILQNRIDELNEQKSVELDNIKEVEEAEKDALKRRQENHTENLRKRHDNEKKALQEEYRLLEKALADDFKARDKHLSNVQKAEKEALDKRMDDQRKALQEAHDNERALQEEATKKNKEELDKQQEEARAAFALREQYWRGMVGRNRAEADAINEAMARDFQDNHLDTIKESDFNTRQAMWRNTQQMHKDNIDQMAQDKAWEDMAKEIAQSVMKGSLGFSMTPSQISKFIRTGELPEERQGNFRSSLNPGGADQARHSAYHSGGIAGRPGDSSWTGPGFRGSSQEIDATLLKGEGILNLRAMNTPGVPEMVQGLNRGALGATPQPTAGMNKRAYGDGPGLPGVIAPIKVMMASLARQATERGVQVGMSKMDAIVEIILSGKNAGLLSGEQLRNAEAIISTGFKMGVSERDIIIGLMTAMQESSLRNVNYGDDIHGVRNPDGSLTSSLGLFQQQKWWGTVEERMDPFKSSELFFKALMDVRNREDMPLWSAAQAVQRSAFPMAYARHETLARTLMENARLMSLPAMSNADFQGGRSGKGMAWQTIWGMVKRAAPEAQMTSNYRSQRNTAVGSQSYHNLGRAVDIISGNMMSTFAKVRGLLPWSELIFTPAGRRQMVNGQPFWDFAPITKAQHYDHIHLAYKNGGSVPGMGKGDKVPAMLEPGEFVVRSAVADRSREFLTALNNGDFNLMPTAGLGHRSLGASANIDTGSHNTYNIDMEFTGSIDSSVDIRKAVFSTIKEIERSKPRSRRVVI